MSKTVLITGCSSGIGKETAKLFYENGWNVSATMRDLRKNPFEEGDRMINPKLDVTKMDTIFSSINKTIDRFGSIDVVVNNAGYALIGPLEQTSVEAIQKEIETNFLGTVLVTKSILPHFRKNKSGLFINISSAAGVVAYPFSSIYNASKAAVEYFSESLMYEVSEFDVRVKVIEPGIVKTDFYSRSLDYADHEEIEFYKKYNDRITNFLGDMSGVSIFASPKKVARLIYKAANDRSHSLRYRVGVDAKLIVFLDKIFPDFIKFPAMKFLIRRLL